jgi:RNA polymerase sigma-70 factor (ECF subfamily)
METVTSTPPVVRAPISFDEVYARYRQRVFVYCLQFLQQRDQAEDVFQDVFVKIYKHENEFATKENLAAWVFTVARNTCLNAVRDRGIAHRHVEFVEPEALHVHAGSVPNVEFDVREYIDWAMSKLPTEQREAIVLREIQDLSYEEIAKITGVSLANVKVRIFRARQRMRKLLGPILREEGTQIDDE